MGVWGTAIFSDDTAADVRDQFKDSIADGLTSEQATDALIQSNKSSLDDPDDGPPFWLGLALTQWKLGRLLPSVKERALRIIDSGEDLRRWDDPALAKKRTKVLSELREKLESPQPPPKKIRRQYQFGSEWPLGTIITYRHRDGRLRLLRVYRKDSVRTDEIPIFELLDWSGASLPTADEISRLRPRQAKGGVTRFLVSGTSKRDFPADRVTVAGIPDYSRR